MILPTNGITADVIRDIMPPYQLSSDLLAAMLTAVPPPPPGTTTAWRQQRCARLVHEVAGLMPANAPQARAAAEIVIVREAVEDTLARAGAAGPVVEQVCRLRRTASALLASVAALERSLVRHQQKPAPFFGTVLVDGIDIAALAARWGAAWVPQNGEEVPAAGEGGAAPMDAAVVVGVTGSAPEASAPPGQDRWQGLVGQGLPAMTAGEGAEMAIDAGPAVALEAAVEVPVHAGPDDAAAGEVAIGEIVQGPYGTGAGGETGATAGVVTRLDQGPGWTLDVVLARKAADGVGGYGVGADGVGRGGTDAIDAARERVA